MTDLEISGLARSWGAHFLRFSGAVCSFVVAAAIRNYFRNAVVTAGGEALSILEKEVSMNLEKDVKIGSNGDADFKMRADGKVEIAVTFGKHFDATDTEVDASVKVVQGAKILMDKLVAALPAGLLRDAAQKAEDLELQREAAAAAPAPQA